MVLNKLLGYRHREPFIYYILTITSVYLVWKGYKLIYYSNDSLTGIGHWLNDHIALSLAKIMTVTLSLLGRPWDSYWEATSYGTFPVVRLMDGGGIFIAYHCLAVPAMAVYTFTLLLLEGSNFRKLLYLMLGLLTIHFTNAARLLTLLYVDVLATDTFFEIYHLYINKIMIYGLVFLFHLTFMRPVLKDILAESKMKRGGNLL